MWRSAKQENHIAKRIVKIITMLASTPRKCFRQKSNKRFMVKYPQQVKDRHKVLDMLDELTERRKLGQGATALVYANNLLC